MKNILLTILAFLMLSCDNYIARHLGGTETITLPAGERLIQATWKETSLWYMTEPMPDGYQPRKIEFKEKSPSGTLEGKVIFIERRETVYPGPNN